MLYAIFCYSNEAVTRAKQQHRDDALMADLGVVQRKLTREGKLGPSARLMPTTTAVTLKHGKEVMVVDGPFAETKEQLLGFYIVDCATPDEAVDIARQLAGPRVAAGLEGSLEVRPIAMAAMDAPVRSGAP